MLSEALVYFAYNLQFRLLRPFFYPNWSLSGTFFFRKFTHSDREAEITWKVFSYFEELWSTRAQRQRAGEERKNDRKLAHPYCRRLLCLSLGRYSLFQFHVDENLRNIWTSLLEFDILRSASVAKKLNSFFKKGDSYLKTFDRLKSFSICAISFKVLSQTSIFRFAKLAHEWQKISESKNMFCKNFRLLMV